MTGGRVVVDAVRAAGVDAVFAIHGVQIDPIFQACLDTGLRLVDVRHEASAGFAAEGYARSGRALGAVAVCPGPGFTNVLTSIANARLDRTPVIYLVSSNPLATFDSNGLQTGIDHVALARPVAKWAAIVSSADALSDAITAAIREALAPPRGPVVLDVTADVLSGPAASARDVGAAQPTVLVPPPSPTSNEVGRCLDLLAAAERPAVVLGDRPGPDAALALRELLATTGMPCFANYGSLGVVDDGDEHHGGSLFQLGRLAPADRPDVALAIGIPLGFDTPGLRDGGVEWGIELIRVDADPVEVDRFGPAALGIVAAPDAAIATLAAACGSRVWPDRSAWRTAVRSALADTRTALDAIEPTASGRVHPYAAARAVADVAMERRAVVVGDGAVCKHWLHDALRVPLDGRYLTHGRLGCMGQGLGVSIGAALATGGPVVCVTGDGALGFSIGELEAIARHGLDMVVVVMNNARWGASMGFQLRHGGQDRVIGTALSDADYHDAARALGGAGERVADVEGVRRAVTGALDRGGLTVINVSTHSDGHPSPELPLLMSHP